MEWTDTIVEKSVTVQPAPFAKAPYGAKTAYVGGVTDSSQIESINHLLTSKLVEFDLFLRFGCE